MVSRIPAAARWFGLALAPVMLAVVTQVRAAALEQVRDFGTNPGNLEMYALVPDDLPPGSALVVVAHGCLQTAQEMAEVSGWSDLALAHRFAVVLPQTNRANDSFAGCFRTWLPEHQQRDQGEPLSVLQMVQWMLKHHRLDPRRVFITGMSSGGHLTNVMLATYPDVFAAGAPQSSFPYKCALEFADVETCCRGLKTHTREAWGDLVRTGLPGYDGPRPRVALWHGHEDPLLVVANLGYEVQQWSAALGIDDVPDETVVAGRYEGHRYTDSTGTARLEVFEIPGLAHAIALDARPSSPKCGKVGPYSTDVEICAAEWIGRWFGVVHQVTDGATSSAGSSTQ